ncbi:PREDICTED: zinc transporter ZIP10-like [Priapulus caudatus]|uniref:Zinc transporter ZIP10-like n=1 Tax=Priapulus caudatus TaxID=37621 RepID=A0ABM1EPX2_PRICU|nr:PREDICTED: zinc transporter ZIP10-like [Priapulus caudatus]
MAFGRHLCCACLLALLLTKAADGDKHHRNHHKKLNLGDDIDTMSSLLAAPPPDAPSGERTWSDSLLPKPDRHRPPQEVATEKPRDDDDDDGEMHEDSFFLDQIFARYGAAGSRHLMDFSGFEHLLVRLGLATLGPELTQHVYSEHATNNVTHNPLHEHNASLEDAAVAATAVQLKEEVKHRHRRSVDVDGNHDNSHWHPGEHWDAGNASKPVRRCMTPGEILLSLNLHTNDHISEHAFLHVCPAIIYELDIADCVSQLAADRGQGRGQSWTSAVAEAIDENGFDTLFSSIASIPGKVWGYATLAILVISLCGLGGVAVVPLLNRSFYRHVLHFLVALAVGSLSGDALLHLFPHALGIHAQEAGIDEHGVYRTKYDAVWKGMTALGGIFGFFLIEQVIQLAGVWRQERTRRKHLQQKLGAAGYDRMAHPHAVGRKLSSHKRDSILYMEGVFMPTSVSSVALMVIMGDGLHNFSDGMAIGAAFANDIAGGMSTTLAVFCHELPHELGGL